MRFSLKSSLWTTAAAALLLAAGRVAWNHFAGPVIPISTLRELRSGMSPAEVKSVLGEPVVVYGESHPYSNSWTTWIYERRFNPGWVEVSFNADGNLDSINDESPCPGAFELESAPSVDAAVEQAVP